MGDNCLLGIDCGLTLVKAVLFRPDGTKIREASKQTPLKDGRIDAEALWCNVCDCCGEICEEHDVIAVGLSGHGNGLYALDNHNHILAALPSMSPDSVHIEDFPRYYSITKQSCWAGQPLQLLRTLKDKELSTYKQVRTLLHCKDYIRYMLTGKLASDYTDTSASALLNIESGEYSPDLFALAGIDDKAFDLPPLFDSTEIGGYISKSAAQITGLKEGTPVSVGLIDLNACMLGAGVLNPELYSVTAGTWGITTRITDRIIDSHSITQNTFCIDKQHRMVVISSPTSCVNLNWFLNTTRPDMSYDEANEIAGKFGPKDTEVLFLPYLYEDMARTGIKSQFIGMSAQTGYDELLRSVYEGVMFSHKDQVERMKKSGLDASSIRLSGGASNSPFWCQLFADGIGLPVETLTEKQVGALGAAMTAAVAVGEYASVQNAAEKMVHIANTTYPKEVGAYDDKFAKFIRMAGEV